MCRCSSRKQRPKRLLALRSRIKGEEGFRGPGYHLHLEEANGSELTIGVLDEPE
jgi:hypothetical protein